MNFYGIENISNEELNFKYDKYYKNLCNNLKQALKVDEKSKIKDKSKAELNNLLKNINIDEKFLKNNFINLLLDEDSAKFLWILYSKYNKSENYIDIISNTLKKENEVVRGGTNTYKINGWMTHTLYVYQIVNYNIVQNIELENFKPLKEIKKQIEELHKIYHTLDISAVFVLKIFCLIHDVGVIENIGLHDVYGIKFVEKVLSEIGVTEEVLKNFNLNLNEFINIQKAIIKYHTLITSLSSEGSDDYVQKNFEDLISNISDENIKKQISKILFLMAYGDVIAVDESLMNTEKYQRIKEGYLFFEEIINGKPHKRDKEKVAIERICDTAGKIKFEVLKSNLDDILFSNKIDKNAFIKNMFNIRAMRYTGPLMKTLNDLNLCIKIYNELLDLIVNVKSEKALKEYKVLFVPDKHENEFVKEFKNGNFFRCIEKMKNTKQDECIYGKTKLVFGTDQDGKYLHIKII